MWTLATARTASLLESEAGHASPHQTEEPLKHLRAVMYDQFEVMASVRGSTHELAGACDADEPDACQVDMGLLRRSSFFASNAVIDGGFQDRPEAIARCDVDFAVHGNNSVYITGP